MTLQAFARRAGVLCALLATAGCATNAVQTAATPVAVNRIGPSAQIIVDPTPPVAIGEQLTFTLIADQNALGHLYLQSGDGEVRVLGENIPLGAGQPVRFPAFGAPYAIEAVPSKGLDKLTLLMTRALFQGMLDGGPVRSPQRTALSQADFAARLQAVTTRLPAFDWGLSEIIIETATPASP